MSYDTQTYELDVYRQQANMQGGGGTMQNQLGGQLQAYPGLQSIQPYYYQCPSASPADFELTINQVSKESEPLLNYGAKLRLLIAEPIAGIDLRDAIAKLRTALKEAYAKHKSV